MQWAHRRLRRRRKYSNSLADYSAFAVLNEADDQLDLVARRQFRAHRIERLSGIIFGTINNSERFLDYLNRFRRNALALHSHHIDSANLCRITVSNHEWR